jgi:gliding motility-associated-like protein
MKQLLTHSPMSKPFRFVLLFALIALSFSSNASHLIGGEIYYTHTSGNNYTVTLKIFRDCGPGNVNGTDFDDAVSIGIFTSNNNLFTDLSINLISTNVSNIPVTLNNPCFVLPPNICVEQAIYTGSVNLPPTPGGYNIVHQRCCFQPSIDNLTSPQSQGVSYVAHVPGTSELPVGYNSSPRFTNFPPPALCKDASFTFDHSAVDPDGDVIVYSFCAPYLFSDQFAPMPTPPNEPPYPNLTYGPGFSPSYPITSSPAMGINPTTGLISGTATQVGQYTITVCAEEYRNGVYISTTRRTFQFNVTLCDQSIVASIPAQTSFCNGLEVNLINQSVNSSFWAWDFGVPFEDTDISTEENPTFTYPNAGTYTITLVANPGWSCSDTSTAEYTVFPEIDPIINVEEYTCVNQFDTYNFLGSATFVANNGTLLWNFGSNSIPSSSDVVHPQGIIFDSNEAVHSITLTATASNGCSQDTTITIVNPPDPVAVIPNQTTFCDGLTYVFENSSLNATDYWWEFNTVFNGDYSDDFEPQFSFPDTGSYTIQLVAYSEFNCPDTTTNTIEIQGNLIPSFPAQNTQCLSTNSFDFQAVGANTNFATYLWDFGSPEIPNSTNANPQNIQYNQEGTYTVTLTITDNGCTESYIDDVWVPADPTLDPSIFPAAGCPPVFGTFNAVAQGNTQLFYEWNFGDGTSSFQPENLHIYNTPGTYDVSLMVYTVTGCIDTLYQSLNDAIVVYPLPNAGFSIVPQTVDILSPNTTVTDLSTGGIDCIYSMSDGGSSSDCNFPYDWSEAGIQTITQTVTNEYGCIDQVTGEVIVSGFLFYAPNSFSPNGDGINDVWIPESTGTTSYNLKIYDRWGQIIFQTNNPNEAWTGNVLDGEYFAANGVYNYQVTMKDLIELPHAFSGHIVLFR